MKIIMAESTKEAHDIVASLIVEKISAHHEAVLGLATGRTMIPVYEALARIPDLKLSEAYFFMLDEYVGLPASHPSSFRSYIEAKVMRPLKLRADQFFYPDPSRPPQRYEDMIRFRKGIDLQLLGIGKNGHIGFNEPGSAGDSRTRIVDLTQTTIEANSKDIEGDFIPKQALSMGIGTILEARALLMLATGESKAEAVKYLLNHHDDPSCPATYLKSHEKFTLVLDPEAASKINLKI